MFYAYFVSLIVYQLGIWFATGAFGIGTAVALCLVAWYLCILFKPAETNGRKTARAHASA